MAKIYLELDQGDAKFFEYSKEPKEGFEKHESSTGKVTYRKNYKDGVKGKLKFINEREQDFGKGKFKSAGLVLEDKQNTYYLTLPILNAKGSLNNYFEELSKFIPNLKIGETYRIFPYAMEQEYKSKRTGEMVKTVNKSFSISTYDLENDEKLVKVDRAFNYEDLPKIVWTEEEDMGVKKNIKNDKELRNFLYNAFLKCVSKTGSTTSDEAPKEEAPKQEPKKEEKPAQHTNVTFEDEEQDDLPF